MKRRIRTDDNLAHQRMDAVGADDGIGLRFRSIRKREHHLAANLVQTDELLVQMNDLWRQHGIKRLMQIGPMHAQERRAVETFRHRQFALDLAGIPDAIEMRIGFKGGAAQFLFDADAAQDAR